MKLYIGIDWSQSKHDVCFLNPSGVVQLHFVIEHTQTGFWKLEHMRQQMGVALEMKVKSKVEWIHKCFSSYEKLVVWILLV